MRDDSSTEALVEVLRKLDGAIGDDWVEGLEQRKREEMDHADLLRDESRTDQHEAEDLKANKKYYSTANQVREYMEAWIAQHARGRVFLDYACGNGETTLRAARAGASLAIGIDISRVSVENAKRAAKAEGLTNAVFLQGDCERTGLPDACIDTILCSGMLHHLDLSYAFPEMRRILKPGGKALASEALGVNPAIQLYRKLTPHLRTAWEAEHILSHAELRFAERFFEVREVRYWNLAIIAATPFRNTPLMGAALAVGRAVDSVLLRIPGIQRMAWIFTFELHKPAP